MSRWRPAPSAGNLIGILTLLLCGGVIAGLVLRAIPEAAAPALAIALWGTVGILTGSMLLVAVLLWGFYSLSYHLDEQAQEIVVRWAWRTVRIPFDEVEYLGPARPLLTATTVRHLWPWPGYYLATLRDPALGRIKLFATVPPQRQVLICSARGSFGLSPDRPAAFAAHFATANATHPGSGPLPTRAQQEHQRPVFPVPAVSSLDEESAEGLPNATISGQQAFNLRTNNQPLALFADRPAVSLLLLGVALVAAMVWFILLRFDAVPQTLPLHYNAIGQPDRIGTPREIFLFPLIIGLVAIANFALAWSVIRFDRFAARLLLGGTCLVQAVAWIALLKIF